MTKEAVIQDAKIYGVFDLWKRKPKPLAFNDTDVVIVTVESGGRKIKESFFTCIKGDGTFSLKTPSRLSHSRREKLAKFLEYYLKVKDPEEYNLKEKIKEWKGKKIELEGDHIFIP